MKTWVRIPRTHIKSQGQGDEGRRILASQAIEPNQ